MAQEAAATAAEGLVVFQRPSQFQQRLPDLWDTIQSHQLAKGQLHSLVAQEPVMAVYGVLCDAV